MTTPDLRWLLLRLPVMLVVLLILGRCDSTELDPFVESDLPFSMAGYLDGGVDTQFVRVTPIRDSIALGPGPLDASVTLEHLETRRVTPWSDSLFLLSSNLVRQAERIAHNFWSPEPLEPLATYRLTVTRSDGAMSAATVTLPDTFPDPIIDGNTVKIRGVERLAEVLIIYRVRDLILQQNVRHIVSYVQDALPVEDELWVFIQRSRDEDDIFTRLGGTQLQLLDIKLVVAAAGPDWPDLTEFDDETLALPDVVSNIENGVGYLGGIISKTLYWTGYGPP